MIERGFWRGFGALLATLAIAPLAIQIEIILIAHLGAGAPAAYGLLTRVALLDVVLVAGAGAVASVLIAKEQDADRLAHMLGQVLALSLAIGIAAAALGLTFYPTLLETMAGAREISALALAALAWHIAATPLRALSSVGIFALHALDRGAWAFRWKLFEVGLKAAGAFLAIYVLGLGFKGLFIAGLAVAALSAFWICRELRQRFAMTLKRPEGRFAASFLRSTMWETQRVLSPQLAVLASLALFAAPWLGRYETARLDAFAAGQVLALLAFTPFTALVRFLAIRLAGRTHAEVARLIGSLWTFGAPIAIGVAAILYIGVDWIGEAAYRQHGPWWTTFIAALAISLPLRYITNVMRGALQALGRFNDSGAADGLASWLAAVPLNALGLYLDAPAIAYLSLIVPEALCGVWLWRRLRLPLQEETARLPPVVELASSPPRGARVLKIDGAMPADP